MVSGRQVSAEMFSSDDEQTGLAYIYGSGAYKEKMKIKTSNFFTGYAMWGIKKVKFRRRLLRCRPWRGMGCQSTSAAFLPHKCFRPTAHTVPRVLI